MNKTLSTIRWPGWRPVSMAVLAVTLIAFSFPGFAAKGGIKGPPVGGETSNNLSLPSIQTQTEPSTSARWFIPNPAVLGTHYSYGCDTPEGNEQFSYPNTSCVDNLDEPSIYYDADECVVQDMPCNRMDENGVYTIYEPFRIYWQKVDVNDWWADDEGTNIWAVPVEAKFVDWGDALEAVTWNEKSVIRVETQPYSSTLIDDLATEGIYEASLLVDEVTGQLQTCADAAALQGLDPLKACKTGFQMWHVSGQGITEHWGVRATDLDDAVSYNYDSPFQIIKSTQARLNLAKMVDESAVCPEPGHNPGEDSPDVGDWTGSEWPGTCVVHDEIYSVETSVGGKYVYGYNWRMRDVDMAACGEGWLKTGFWRLTFYAPDDIEFDIDTSMFKLVDLEGEPYGVVNKAPPSPVAEARVLVEEATVFNTSAKLDLIASAESEEGEEEDPNADDRLYRPVIDNDKELTYIDICIEAKSQGGGGGGGGKPDRGDKPGGGGGGGKPDGTPGGGGGGGGGGSKGGNH